MSLLGPWLPTCALQLVGSYLRYTGHQIPMSRDRAIAFTSPSWSTHGTLLSMSCRGTGPSGGCRAGRWTIRSRGSSPVSRSTASLNPQSSEYRTIAIFIELVRLLTRRRDGPEPGGLQETGL